MTIKPVIAIVAIGCAAAGLSGCNLLPFGKDPPPPQAEDCGADLVAQYVGSKPSPETSAYIAARVGERPIRTYTVGDPVTMDYIRGRLNVVLSKDGRIQAFRCG